MNLNLTATNKITESEARAAYTKALSAFDAQARNCESLAEELEEEQNLLNKLKGELDAAQLTFIQSVERTVFEPKTKDDDAKSKMESRTVSKILGRTKDAPSGFDGAADRFKANDEDAKEGAQILANTLLPARKTPKPHSEETAPPAVEATDAPAMFSASGTRPEVAPDAPAYAGTDVTEADRDEDALAIPTPGQRRAENISELSPERAEAASDVLKAVDNILNDD